MAKTRPIPLGGGLFRVVRNRRRQPISTRPVREPSPLPATEETQRFQQLIADVGEVYRPSGVLIWLNSSNKHLDGKSPRELIDSGTDDDWAALLNEGDRLAEGSGW